MPNWTTNTLKVVGKPEDVDKFVAHIGEEMDFEKVIPSPANMFKGNLGEPERERCIKEGIPNWYDWQSEHWGTKWNAHSEETVELEMLGYIGLKQATYIFDTTWDTPRPVITKLCEDWPDLEFEGGYIHEGYEGCGSFFEFSNRK